MTVAYALVPAVIVALIRFLPDSIEKLTVPYILALLVFGFPLIVLLAFVLPVTGIVSLLRSYREFREGPQSFLKGPLEWIVLSQIAGGTLAILFAPETAKNWSAPVVTRRIRSVNFIRKFLLKTIVANVIRFSSTNTILICNCRTEILKPRARFFAVWKFNMLILLAGKVWLNRTP